MSESIIMPRLGNTVETCILNCWAAKTGQSVQPGTVLCEVGTDKISIDVRVEIARTLFAPLVEEGDEVPVLTPVAAVGAPGESAPEGDPTKLTRRIESQEGNSPATKIDLAGQHMRLQEETAVVTDGPKTSDSSGPALTPCAIQLVKERAVDLVKQPSWLIDPIHERVCPLQGYEPTTNRSRGELLSATRHGLRRHC